MESAATRARIGFSAGAIAVLVFHQGLAGVFDIAGLGSMRAFRLLPTWPFGVPALVSLSFWGSMYGIAFALLSPRFGRLLWLAGLGMGLIAGMITLFVVLPLKGLSVAHGWAAWPVARTLLLTSFWGLGVGMLLPLLRPRPLHRPVARAVRA